MFWLIIQVPNSFSFTAVPFETSSAAVLAAEEAYKAGQSVKGQPAVPSVQVFEQGRMLAKWGPLDPGGIFNTERDEAGR